MNVLITGANGYIGKNLMQLLSGCKGINLFPGTRETVDLYSRSSVFNFSCKNKIDTIIHCAIEGGNRLKKDSPDIVYKNLLMFENLADVFEYCPFINIGSGAEYDKSKNITDIGETTLEYFIPTDYYGFSKNLIARKVNDIDFGVNLRLFGCFYHNELNTRFIRSNIERYIRNEPMIIHEDKHMGFFYMEDLATTIEYVLKNKFLIRGMDIKTINMSYSHTHKLSELACIINELDDHKVKIVVEDDVIKHDYFGYGGNLLRLPDIKLKGLKVGIKECYERLKKN